MPQYHELVDAHKGRCAVASVAIQAGSCILRTFATCAVSFSSCGSCFTAQVSLFRCTGCRKARYCSRKCQQRDWPQHRRECSAWSLIPCTTTSPTVLLVTRLAAKLFLGIEIDRKERDRVLRLRHHLNDHSEHKRRQFKEMTHLVLLVLSRYKQDERQQIASFDELQKDLEMEILQLFGRVNCNAFSVASNVTNETLGIGLFPDGALFNHDCDPNCVVSFRGQEMLVHAVKDVRAGQELTVSYLELLQSTTARRKQLKESYFFDCECSRCQTATNKEDDWYLNGLKCSNKKTATCEGLVVLEKTANRSTSSAVCKMCGTERDIAAIEKFERQLKEVEAFPVATEDEKWDVCQRRWEIVTQRLRLHPQSSRVAAIAREIGNFLCKAKCPDLRYHALSFFQAELRAVQWLLPDTKLPSRGLLHYQIGQLLCERAMTPSSSTSSVNKVEQIECAAKHLRHALLVLSCAYGRDSAAVQSVQSMLDEAQRTALELS